MRTCSKCFKEKPLSSFYVVEGERRERQCKECRCAAIRAYRKAHPDVVSSIKRRGAWLRRYGITESDYIEMLARQGGVCAICGGCQPKTPRGGTRFCIDHDHNTGRVRGLLCVPCNTAVGLMGESTERMMRAVVYLQAVR